MTNEMINMLINKMEGLEAAMKQLKAEAEAIELQLKSELDERKVDSIDTGFYNIFYLLQSKHTFNSTAFKKANPELHEQFCEDKVNTYFRITKHEA